MMMMMTMMTVNACGYDTYMYLNAAAATTAAQPCKTSDNAAPAPVTTPHRTTRRLHKQRKRERLKKKAESGIVVVVAVVLGPTCMDPNLSMRRSQKAYPRCRPAVRIERKLRSADPGKVPNRNPSNQWRARKRDGTAVISPSERVISRWWSWVVPVLPDRRARVPPRQSRDAVQTFCFGDFRHLCFWPRQVSWAALRACVRRRDIAGLHCTAHCTLCKA